VYKIYIHYKYILLINNQTECIHWLLLDYSNGLTIAKCCSIQHN